MDGGAAVRRVVQVLLALVAGGAAAFELSWTTVDGGGTTWAAGGGFTLGATVGQPDAGRAAGAGFAVEGGFWPGVLEEPGWTVPTLRIDLVAGLPHVYWPADTTNALLSASVHVNDPAWSVVTSPPTLVGAEWRVSVGGATGAVFRLENGP